MWFLSSHTVNARPDRTAYGWKYGACSSTFHAATFSAAATDYMVSGARRCRLSSRSSRTDRGRTGLVARTLGSSVNAGPARARRLPCGRGCPGARLCLQVGDQLLAVALPQHPDEHRSQHPIFFAVDPDSRGRWSRGGRNASGRRLPGPPSLRGRHGRNPDAVANGFHRSSNRSSRRWPSCRRCTA